MLNTRSRNDFPPHLNPLPPKSLSHNSSGDLPSKAGIQDYARFLGPRLRGDDGRTVQRLYFDTSGSTPARGRQKDPFAAAPKGQRGRSCVHCRQLPSHLNQIKQWYESWVLAGRSLQLKSICILLCGSGFQPRYYFYSCPKIAAEAAPIEFVPSLMQNEGL